MWNPGVCVGRGALCWVLLFGDSGALGREVSCCCGIWGLLGSPVFGDLMNEVRKWGFCAAPTLFGVSEICGVKQEILGGQSPCESTECRELGWNFQDCLTF